MGARALSPWGRAERAWSGMRVGGVLCPPDRERACRPRPLFENVWAGRLLVVGPVGVSDVAGGDGASVECAVAHPVGCCAVLTGEAVGCAVARVTVGPVAVELSVAVGTSSAVVHVVTSVNVGGDPAGDRAVHTCRSSRSRPRPAWAPGQLGVRKPLARAVCLPPADTLVLCQPALTRGGLGGISTPPRPPQQTTPPFAASPHPLLLSLSPPTRQARPARGNVHSLGHWCPCTCPC